MSQITLYPASNYLALGPTQGCGEEHRRPLDPHTGKLIRRWGVECPVHEAYHMGYSRPKVLKYLIDPKTGQSLSQQRVLDSQPGFSTNPDSIPLTYDEEHTRHLRLEQGENQLRALESLIALKGGGLDLTSRPDVMFYLQESGLPSEMLQGKLECANGHDNAAGAKFCGECGVGMTVKAARGAIAPPEDEPAVVDLGRLHVQSLRKMCREAGVPDKGSKDDLIGRLQAAA